MTNFNFNRQLSRRTVLRGTGVAMSLPWISAMQPAFAAGADAEPPRRFVAMTLGLGLLGENLNPQEAVRGYTTSRYLKSVDDLRDQFTVISGSSHPGVSGGHTAEASILTANHVGRSSGAKNTISLDQYLAKHLGQFTRFPSLVLGNASNSPSYTENGAMIPAETSPSRIFQALFINDSPEEQTRQAKSIRQGRSIMDLISEDAKRLSAELGTGDRARLDDYFTSVRQLELRLAASEAWSHRPKPEVDAPKPVDIRDSRDFVGQQELMSDVIRLALRTDSSRFITYHLGGSGGVVPIEGVSEGYHTLSHHGRDEDKMTQLALVEEAIVASWGDFLRGLAEIKEDGETLLDRTSVLLTSNLGNASSHDNRNMPVLFAGGGFQHGQHLAFDQRNNYPLPNLFVSLLQRHGLEMDRFATGTTTMTGLKFS